MRSIVIDTDLNFPSDDLQAVLLLATDPDICLKGVSASAGNTFSEEVLVNILAVRKLLRSVTFPVSKGAPYTRFESRRGEVFNAMDAYGLLFSGSFQKGSSPRFNASPQSLGDLSSMATHSTLADLIEMQDCEIDLICLGPLTNLADLVDQRPDLMTRIRMVWFMGANHFVSLDNPKMDFNVWYDPESALRVFKSGIALTIFSYELCRLNRCSVQLLERLKGHKRGLAKLFVEDFEGMARQHGATMPLCDQLVALCVINPCLILEKRPCRIDVCFEKGKLFGSSSMREVVSSRVSAVSSVDFESLSSVLLDHISMLEEFELGAELDDFLRSPLYRIDGW